MKAKFHIPDIWVHKDLNLYLIDMIKEHPEFFYDDIEIASCYGCFPSALWNGGRALGGLALETQITSTIKAFNDRNVPIRYTFTNPTLTEKDLKDKFCNHLCAIAENGFNELIVNKPFLEDYVRRNYPKFPLVSSTVKQIEDYDQLMEEFKKDYKLVVLDYNWNNDFEKLDKIPQELRSRVEILINPYCTPHCKRRKQHYEVLGESQRKCSKQTIYEQLGAVRSVKDPMEDANNFNCPNTRYNFYQITHYSTFVSNNDVYGRYLDMGFNNFKIEGRVLSKPNVIESYVYYLVKPEYRDRVRLDMLTYRPPVQEIKEHPRLFIDKNGREIPQRRV